jgi:putative transposase
MAKRAKPEEIIAKLREVEVRLSQGESVGKAAKAIGVTEQTYYRWRKEYGGLQVNQAKRLKDMEKENARLRKAISDLMLDKQILEEVIKDPKGSAAKSSEPLPQTPGGRPRER